MSDLFINIRFGSRHLQIGPRWIAITRNPYWESRKPDPWFEVYRFFWWAR